MLQAYREIVYRKIPAKMSRLFHGSARCQQIRCVLDLGYAVCVNLIAKFELLMPLRL